MPGIVPEQLVMLVKLTLLTLGLLQPLSLSPPSIDMAFSGALALPEISTHVQPLAEETLYIQAFELIDRNRWQDVRKLLRRGQHQGLNRYILWLDIRRPVRHHFDTIASFIRDNPHWPEPELLQRRAEEAMTEAIPHQQVLDWFATREPLTTHGYIRLVAALRRDNQLETATQLARRIWVQRVFGPAQARRFLETQGDLLRPEDHWGRLDRLLWEGHINAARGLLARVDAAHRTLAQARIGLRSFHPQVDELIAAVDGPLQDDPGLLYERFRWRISQSRSQAAMEILARAPRPLVQGQYWWPEIHALIQQTLQQGDYQQAYRIAAQHGQNTPRSGVEGDWLAGWLALRHLGRPEEAMGHFRNLYQRASYPTSQSRGAYWTGRSLEAMGNPRQAREWYLRAATHRETFYGQQAAHHLALPPRPVAAQPSAANLQAINLNDHELVKVIHALIRLGQTERTRPLLERLGELAQQQAQPDMLVMAAQLAKHLDKPDWAVRIGKERAREGFVIYEAAYPLLDLVDQTVNDNSDLVHAIIRQESLFDARAQSHAGASGLMQLMPRTAQAVAESLGLDYRQRWLVDEPQYNIRLGHAYIRQMLQRWDGNLILAIASYNAGPTRVQSWVNAFGDPRHWGVDPIDWVESIPFTETRNYVQRVMANLHVYQGRLQYLELANL